MFPTFRSLIIWTSFTSMWPPSICDARIMSTGTMDIRSSTNHPLR